MTLYDGNRGFPSQRVSNVKIEYFFVVILNKQLKEGVFGDLIRNDTQVSLTYNIGLSLLSFSPDIKRP